MTAKNITPHHVSVQMETRKLGRREITTYRWVCTRGCLGRPSGNQEMVTRRGKRHEERRIGRTTRR